MTHPALSRALAFAKDYGLRVPILMAPMAGACPPALASAVADAGGMGACGTVMMPPDAIKSWAIQMRAASNGAFQLNTWIPDPDPVRDPENEAALRDFLSAWGPDVPAEAIEDTGQDFMHQCEAMLAAGPAVMSSIMGLYPPDVVAAFKTRGIRWFATVTTVAEARAAVDAGADVIVAQGAEAGGHRGAFNAQDGEDQTIGLMSLVPAVVDAVDVPVVATGGIADGRTAAAALLLGASAVQIGTALLRSPEAGIPSAWADAIGAADPETTRTTRAFSGRLGRALDTEFLRASHAKEAPTLAPFPIQRALTAPMRANGAAKNDLSRINTWAGQSAGLAQARPAKDIIETLWTETQTLLRG
ncbi:MAG: nitronate monooxygenase [Pseudomonadota bacterium]